MLRSSSEGFKKIHQLLQAENSELVRGKLGSLAKLQEQKIELLSNREIINSLTEQEVATLRQLLVHSGKLLEAASIGVGSVLKRILDVQESQGSLQTYDSVGQRQTYKTAELSFEKMF